MLDKKKIVDLCYNLSEVIKVLKKDRRIEIIQVLEDKEYGLTVKELHGLTNIPTGNLYNHLDKLYNIGLICRANEHPFLYKLTPFTYKLLLLIE